MDKLPLCLSGNTRESDEIDVECQYLDIENLCKCKNQRTDLNVLHLNIRSLPSKFDKMKLFLEELQKKNTKPDVILLCETWLSERNGELFNMPGYILTEKHSVNNRSGGVCIHCMC